MSGGTETRPLLVHLAQTCCWLGSDNQAEPTRVTGLQLTLGVLDVPPWPSLASGDPSWGDGPLPKIKHQTNFAEQHRQHGTLARATKVKSRSDRWKAAQPIPTQCPNNGMGAEHRRMVLSRLQKFNER